VRDKIARLVAYLTRLPDTPERTALAFAVGVFFGFSPLVGLQTIGGIVFAYFQGLSRVAVILGTWVNLPWIVPVYYAVATEVGARLLGVEPPSGLGSEIRAVFARAGFGLTAIVELLELFRPMLWPFVLGTSLGSVLLGLVAHRVMLVLLRARKSPLPDTVPPGS
jgi:uncharacterized protein (DUF2062 family)